MNSVNPNTTLSPHYYHFIPTKFCAENFQGEQLAVFKQECLVTDM